MLLSVLQDHDSAVSTGRVLALLPTVAPSHRWSDHSHCHEVGRLTSGTPWRQTEPLGSPRGRGGSSGQEPKLAKDASLPFISSPPGRLSFLFLAQNATANQRVVLAG